MSLGPAYHRLWTGSALSNLADGIFQVALPLLSLRLTDSPGLVAGVAFAGRLPWLVFVLHAGALADRLDRRRTMINVDSARAVVLASLTTVIVVGHEQLWLLYVVAFALGIFETLFDTAAQSIMPAIVEKDRLSHANGRLYAAEMTMNLFVGPPLGGLLAGVAIAAAFVKSLSPSPSHTSADSPTWAPANSSTRSSSSPPRTRRLRPISPPTVTWFVPSPSRRSTLRSTTAPATMSIVSSPSPARTYRFRPMVPSTSTVSSPSPRRA